MTGHKTNNRGPSPLEESTMYEKAKALCPDGKVRVIYHGEADSFFSAPAYARIRGKYVSGFVMKISMVDMPPTMLPKSGLEFVPYTRNAHLIPDTLKSTKAIWDKTFPHALPPKYRWIWERF